MSCTRGLEASSLRVAARALSISLLLAASTPSPSPGSAPSPPDSSGGIDSLAYAKLAREVGSRSLIRVVPLAPGASVLEMSGPRIAPDGIRYAPARAGDAGPVRVGWTEIRSVEIRRSGTEGGALIGAAILGGVGLLLAVDSGHEDGASVNVPGVTMLFATLGAGLGAAMGAAASSWEPIYATHGPAGGFATAPAASVRPAAAQVSSPGRAIASRPSKFVTEFGLLYRTGRKVDDWDRYEERLTVLWNFGPMFRIGERNSVGLVGHVTYAGPDNPRVGAMARVSHSFSPSSSVDLSGGVTCLEEGQRGVRVWTRVLEAGWRNPAGVQPTVMVQFPATEGGPKADPRVYLGAKLGSKAGLVTGIIVPLAVATLLAAALAS